MCCTESNPGVFPMRGPPGGGLFPYTVNILSREAVESWLISYVCIVPRRRQFKRRATSSVDIDIVVETTVGAKDRSLVCA